MSVPTWSMVTPRCSSISPRYCKWHVNQCCHGDRWHKWYVRQSCHGDRWHKWHVSQCHHGDRQNIWSSMLIYSPELCSYSQVKWQLRSSFNFSYPTWDIYFTCRDFRWTIHINFLSTNDEWRHHTRGVARNGPSSVLIEPMMSFIISTEEVNKSLHR